MKQYDETDHRELAMWAADCAERVLPLFEKSRPDDLRPRQALEAGREWVRSGLFSMAAIRRASLDAHAAARDVGDDPVACAAARACGQAVATAHVPQHSYGGAYYALKALAALDVDDPLDAVLQERDWQAAHAPARLRNEIMDRIVVSERAGSVHVTVLKDGDF